MEEGKLDFYKQTAKALAASTRLYGVDAVIHVENVDDIWFWRQMLSKYRPGHYKFLPATRNEKGKMTSGCEQCLKYRDFLSQRFFICIDSDLRRLSGESLSAKDGILQTYTYSWENHCAFSTNLQNIFAKHITGNIEFDFTVFLKQYSQIVYEPFIFMLYQKRNGINKFSQNDFNRAITQQYMRGDENNSGTSFLLRMKNALDDACKDVMRESEFDYTKEAERYYSFGLNEENAYLYVRGHCLYNSLVSIGAKLCEDTDIDFENNILKEALAFEQYKEIINIKNDIEKIQALRISF